MLPDVMFPMPRMKAKRENMVDGSVGSSSAAETYIWFLICTSSMTEDENERLTGDDSNQLGPYGRETRAE